ncbi:MAG: HAMP domain-containing histidine kinase [Acidobacteria bacterium]|nr:HAMP domain-containing histidine kinase [Acidobacteriota bacterium]
MLIRVRPVLQLRSGQGLLTVFALTILLPGVLLTVFGVRAWLQERRLAEQQVREQLGRVADLGARDLERELDRWRRLADGLSPGSLPQEVRQAVAEAGLCAMVFVEKQGVRVLPQGQIPYDLGAVALDTLPAALALAEAAELRHKQYAKAEALYRQALSAVEPRWRPLVMHRLARASRRQGRNDEALRIYQQLAATPEEQVGPLSSELIGKFELCSLRSERAACALDFYRELVTGRWRLDKPRYLFYSERVREWLRGASPQAEELRATERKKLALAGAVEQLTTAPRRLLRGGGITYLAFWRVAPFAGFVLAESFFQGRVWPRVLAVLGADFEGRVIAPDGSAPSRPGLSAARALEGGWRLEVWPRDPSALYGGVTRRRNLYFTMLLLVVALLGFGGYLTVCIVRRELEVARLKSDFVSAVSHEFRSPLTGIRQLGELLMRGRVKDEERRQEYYRLITREADRLTRVVENVLDFSRMEEGRKEYHFEPLEAGPWLTELAAAFQAEVAEKGYQVEASVPVELPALTADREALSLAVRNLLDNAVKYSPEAKTVWLEAEAADARLSIRVRDRGVGIPPEDQNHVFEKFYRGRGEIAKQVKGAGLGLSLVKRIVEAHLGAVEFASRMGEGSTFTIHLPLTSERQRGIQP